VIDMSLIVEDAIGIVDGVNREFDTSVAYNTGSLEVFVNGILARRQDDDGWIEKGGTRFEMKESPYIGDLLKVAYRI
jgi:hypothetical protein